MGGIVVIVSTARSAGNGNVCGLTITFLHCVASQEVKYGCYNCLIFARSLFIHTKNRNADAIIDSIQMQEKESLRIKTVNAMDSISDLR